MKYNYIYSPEHGIEEIDELTIIDRGDYLVYKVNGVDLLEDYNNNNKEEFLQAFKVYDIDSADVFVLLKDLNSLYIYVDAVIQQFYDDNMEDNNEEED